MNPFFGERRKAPIPNRLYARTIDSDGVSYVLFDAVDARWFDRTVDDYGERLQPDTWRELIDSAPIYAVEVNAHRGKNMAAMAWLETEPRPPPWAELTLEADPEGPCDVYDNIEGPPQRANMKVKPLRASRRKAIKAATKLSASSEPAVRAAIPTSTMDQAFVLDVGQGGAAALLDDQGQVAAYVDLGAGVLADAGTWPKNMMGLCLQHDPTVILTHWHYDHFHAANKYPGAKSCTWIAPLQTLGPGPQSAMAADIMTNGQLLVWGGSGKLAAGVLELERCSGPAGNCNRTGLAVWVKGPANEDPILLPGDAGYSDIPSIATGGRSISSFVASHHGGQAAGRPPADPGLASARVVFSFGNKNSYGHPLPKSITPLTTAGWTIGPFPGAHADDYRTEDRGTAGLGHVRLEWQSSTRPARACSGCGCTIDPTQ